MSSLKIYSILCDLPQKDHPADDAGTCPGGVGDGINLAEAREQARSAGWVRVGGKDYCPAARKAIKP
jgi:hypothetical protein